MTWQLYVEHRDIDGNVKTPFLNPVTLRYSKNVDTIGILNMSVNAKTYNNFVRNDILIVRIRNKSLGLANFTPDFVGIIRAIEYRDDENNQKYINVTAYDPKIFLNFRVVAYPSGTIGKTTFQSLPAETITKSIVAQNMGISATTANGRLRNGTFSPTISIEPDAGSGNVISISVFGNSVLTALTKVTNIGGGDFDLVYDIDSNIFVFKFFEGQLGEDKTSGAKSVTFSLKNATMRNPKLDITEPSGTVGIVAGNGEAEERAFVIVEGGDYNVNDDIEIFIDARSIENDILPDHGLVKLYDVRRTYQLQFDVNQTTEVFYSPVDIPNRKTYSIGDLVVADYQGIYYRKIDNVTVTYQDQGSSNPFIVDISTMDILN